MPPDHSSQTSVTLLGRLRHNPKDQAAWTDFVAKYQPKILGGAAAGDFRSRTRTT